MVIEPTVVAVAAAPSISYPAIAVAVAVVGGGSYLIYANRKKAKKLKEAVAKIEDLEKKIAKLKAAPKPSK